MKRFLSLVLALLMLFMFTACGSQTTDTDAKKAAPTDSLSVCLASEPDTIDPALNSTMDGATLVAHLFSGLARWSKDEKGNDIIVADIAKELSEGVINDDGTVTYTYKLRDDLKWSDGTALTAEDFVFSWNRAASPETSADYCTMFSYIEGYSEMWETDGKGNFVNPDAKLAVEAPDENTLVVTLCNSLGFWNELLAFPIYYPVHEETVKNEAWATQASTYVCNGPYTLSSWEHKSVITLTKNKYYHSYDSVTMPELKFYLSDNETNMVTNYKTGDWLLIDNVPVVEIPNLKKAYPDEFHVGTQLGTYYLCWNINEDILPEGSSLTGTQAEAARAEIRRAVSALIERNYITEYISQGGQFPASSFVAKGLTDAESGSQFYENAGDPDKGYIGYINLSPEAYWENCRQAEAVLKKYYTYDEETGKFTDFPTIEYIYNTDDNHQKIAEFVYNTLKLYGINVSLRNEEWNTFVNTRKQGDFTVARNGWIADYNDPISFLDLWLSTSGNNDVQFGKCDHAKLAAYSLDLREYGIDVVVEKGAWAETYDVLISEIKKCLDTKTRYELMHLAEDMLMSTGCVTPIYYYSDVYMLDSRVQGFYTNPLGFKYFMFTQIVQ